MTSRSKAAQSGHIINNGGGNVVVVGHGNAVSVNPPAPAPKAEVPWRLIIGGVVAVTLILALAFGHPSAPSQTALQEGLGGILRLVTRH